MSTDILTTTFINFRAMLRSVAAGIAGKNEADDVIHDAFCRLWASQRTVEDEKEAIKLSYTAVRNSAIDTLRRSKSRPTVSMDETPQLADVTDHSQLSDQQLTYEAVMNISRSALNPRQAEVFELHDVNGLGYDEIAAKLGMTPENVRVTVSRSRKIIREIYRKQNEI